MSLIPAMEIFLHCLFIIGSMNFRVANSVLYQEHDIRDILRKKRSLLFPDPLESETKVQVLFGLGLPMESQVSMTLGYVLKCNYRLPYNASSVANDRPNERRRYARVETSGETAEEASSSSSASRDAGTISRWSLYRMLETLMENAGWRGRACLLRAICESAEVPFLRVPQRHGIIGEILHALLTPSTTDEGYETDRDSDYHVAELRGRESRDDYTCRMIYSACPESPLNYFTVERQV